MSFVKRHHRRRRIVTVIIVFIVLFGLGAAAVVFFGIGEADTNQASPDLSQLAPIKVDHTAEQELAKQNDLRKEDARQVAYATTYFYNHNGAQWPTSFREGILVSGADSTPSPVKFGYYKTGTVGKGKQPPLQTDEIRLVVDGHCANSLSATEATIKPYEFAIQYSIKLKDGTYNATCLDP